MGALIGITEQRGQVFAARILDSGRQASDV